MPSRLRPSTVRMSEAADVVFDAEREHFGKRRTDLVADHGQGKAGWDMAEAYLFFLPVFGRCQRVLR